VVALLADAGEPLVDRELVNHCAESCRNWACWPTFCNAVPYWMRPGDVVHVLVTDLTWRGRWYGDTPTGNTPAFLNKQMLGDRQVPNLFVYVNKHVARERFYRTVCHELTHLFLSRAGHNPDPQFVSHDPPGPWQDWGEMALISVAAALYYDDLASIAGRGVKIDWPDRPDDGKWDVVGLWPEGAVKLPAA
jgi:hypothetical protein